MNLKSQLSIFKNSCLATLKVVHSKILAVLNSDARAYLIKYGAVIGVVMAIIGAVTLYTNVKELSKISNHTLEAINDEEIGYVDTDYYCRAVECEYIYIGDRLINVNDYSLSVVDKPYPLAIINSNVYYRITNSGTDYYINVTGYLISEFRLLTTVFFVLLIAAWVFSYFVLTDERLTYMYRNHSRDGAFQHEIIFNMASNINHEVNTPLMVLNSMRSDIGYELDMLNTDDKSSMAAFKESIIEMLDIGDMAIKQIKDTVSSLSEFKRIKGTNGDQNLYMLINTAIKMVNRTNTASFRFTSVSTGLEAYSVHHKLGMTNSFFLNIILNHIQNSLDAHANVVLVEMGQVVDDIVEILIKDNGDGVPVELRDTLFNLDVTSKNHRDVTGRGAGLYLNKVLLNNGYQGDVNLVKTKRNTETIFSVKIKCDKYKYHKEDS